MTNKSPAPTDSAKVEDTGEPVAWMVTNTIYGSVSLHLEEREAHAYDGLRQYTVEPLFAAPRLPNTVPSTQADGEPWQVGDDTSSVQISRDGSTHKWGCKCEGCASTTGSAPVAGTLTIHDVQKKAIEHGFVYWRAPDAHGVSGSKPQAIELLQDLLGVEVEIKDNGCSTCDGTGMIGGPSFYEPDEGGEPCPDCNAAGVLTGAARDVLGERQRQVTAEGWTPEHDDEYLGGELAGSAACYCLGALGLNYEAFENFWPWDEKWWKPTSHRRDLIKAGALILAEIERLDRAALLAASMGGDKS